MTTADLLPEFEQEMGKTREALSRLPDDGLEFRPHEKSWMAIELAAHIANVPTWITMTLGSSGWRALTWREHARPSVTMNPRIPVVPYSIAPSQASTTRRWASSWG